MGISTKAAGARPDEPARAPPILYASRESGHSYKIALALALLGLDHEVRTVDLTTPRASRAPDFQQVSRFGEVPVLVDGQAIVQSNAILLHLVRSTARLGGQEGVSALEQWLFWEANRIGFSFANLRFVRKFVPDTPAAVIAFLLDRAVTDLDRLDRELSANKPFLTGNEISVADIACCGYLFWADQACIDLSQWPALSAWLERIMSLKGWQHPYDLLG